MKNLIGIGVAGNFARHLEQAKEITDFAQINSKDGFPKGVFAFYVPNSSSFLGAFSLSSEFQSLSNDDNVQAEPELCFYTEFVYENSQIIDLIFHKFSCFNDSSLRKPAPKISHKKNWGKNSKGIADKWLELDKFEQGGVLDNYRICSFLKRKNTFFEYGINASLLEYGCLYNIKSWLINQLNTQKDEFVLENMQEFFKVSKYPRFGVISIGATAYTEFGENNFLLKDDEFFMVLYPNKYKNPLDLISKTPNDCIVLHQVVVAS